MSVHGAITSSQANPHRPRKRIRIRPTQVGTSRYCLANSYRGTQGKLHLTVRKRKEPSTHTVQSYTSAYNTVKHAYNNPQICLQDPFQTQNRMVSSTFTIIECEMTYRSLKRTCQYFSLGSRRSIRSIIPYHRPFHGLLPFDFLHTTTLHRVEMILVRIQHINSIIQLINAHHRQIICCCLRLGFPQISTKIQFPLTLIRIITIICPVHCVFQSYCLNASPNQCFDSTLSPPKWYKSIRTLQAKFIDSQYRRQIKSCYCLERSGELYWE